MDRITLNMYTEEDHTYTIDGVEVPSLTGMLTTDGWCDHLDRVPEAILKAKTEWGGRLHQALLLYEYGYGVDDEFRQHTSDWFSLCRKMRWGPPPIWKKAEVPMFVDQDGFRWGFTPDRAHPIAGIVEIKGTYDPHPSHSIQTALQVIGLGYPRNTLRYVAYFDKKGIKKLHLCEPSLMVNGTRLDVFAEAERIIFEHALSV